MKEVFKSRILPGVVIIFTSVATLCIYDGWPFKVLFLLACLFAYSELVALKCNVGLGWNIDPSIANRRRNGAYILLIGGTFYVCFATSTEIFLLIICAWGADAAGWLGGRLMGHRLLKSSPFPKLSPKKTFEGTVCHLVAPALIFFILYGACWLSPDSSIGFLKVTALQSYFTLTGPLVLMGDLYISSVKRAFNVKDSIDGIVKQNGVYQPIKDFLGSHGGILDRIDSVVFTGTTLLLLNWIYILFS